MFIVLGGDGFMLASLKKYQKYKIPFYGMNKGNRGFLLNRFDEKDLINKINKADIAELHPLEMYARNKNGKVKTAMRLMRLCPKNPQVTLSDFFVLLWSSPPKSRTMNAVL